MGIKEMIDKLVTPPKKGKGSSGLGTGMLDETARKIKKRKDALNKAAGIKEAKTVNKNKK